LRRIYRPTRGDANPVALPPERHRLALELTLAVAFKVFVLGLLWFAFFRPDPERPKPLRADLFSPSDSVVLQEIRHDDRR
jgi:hypothetical protein